MLGFSLNMIAPLFMKYVVAFKWRGNRLVDLEAFRENSNSVDRGVYLPNVNDGFVGTAHLSMVKHYQVYCHQRLPGVSGSTQT